MVRLPKEALLKTYPNVMATSSHLFVALLIAIFSFAPRLPALGAWQKPLQSQASSELSSYEQENLFQRYPPVKQLLTRLDDKSLTADQHVEVAREVISEVEAIDNDVLKFHAYLALMDYSSIRIDLEVCGYVLDLAAEIDEKVDAPELTARLQYFRARYLNKVGKFREAIELIKKAQASKLLSNRDRISSDLVLGVLCERLGLFEQAFVAMQKVLAIGELDSSGDHGVSVRIAKSNVGAMLVQMKKYEKAAAVFNELDPLDPPGFVFLQVTLGRCEIALLKNDIDAAIELSQNAIDVSELPEDKYSEWLYRKRRGFVGLLYLMQTRCFFKREDFLTAQRLCERAIELLENRPHRLHDAKAMLGVIVAKRGQPELGIKIVRESYEAAEAAGYIYSKLVASERLTQLYEDNGRLQDAFAQYELTEEIENSMKVEDWGLQLELSELQHKAKLEEWRITTEERAKTKRAELVSANAISQAEKSKTIQFGIGLAFALTLLGGAGYLISQSRRKKIQNQLNEERERAEHQEKLAQKKRIEDIGELAESVAHEFNNILQVICQTNFLIEDSLGEHLTSIQKKLLQNEGNAVAVASKITEQLLTYTKQQAVDPKVALVSTLLESTQELFGSVRDSTQVSVLGFDETLAIDVDQAQFSSSILNLLLNARDSMEGTGLIEIRVTEQTIPKPNSLQLQAGDYVCIEVSDTGKGMSDEQLQRACDPFFTTKPPAIGTGLGLSSVKGFVEQAAGAIKIGSTLGRDATVSLYFPKVDATENLDQPFKSEFSETTSTERVCLIVEDNPQVRSTLELMMESCGYKSTSCCSADDAHDLLKTEHGFSLILSDIRMPGEWNGIDLAQWIKVTFPEIQVVLISGNDAPADLDHITFLRKPFRFTDLQAVLEIEPVHQ